MNLDATAGGKERLRVVLAPLIQHGGHLGVAIDISEVGQTGHRYYLLDAVGQDEHLELLQVFIVVEAIVCSLPAGTAQIESGHLPEVHANGLGNADDARLVGINGAAEVGVDDDGLDAAEDIKHVV